MIARLTGTIYSKTSTSIIIDCNGVGYQINIPTRLSENSPEVGKQFSLPVFLVVKEDLLNLYGFEDESEKKFFELLISTPGIGPKTAIGILSAVDASKLRNFLLSSDLVSLTKLPGIGKKTAERLVLELKDKALKMSSDGAQVISNFEDEALSALITLGYNRATALKLIDKAIKTNPESKNDAELLIRLSLGFALK